MTKNNFNTLKKVLVGDFADNRYMKQKYQTQGDPLTWKLYDKIASESKQDLDNLEIFYKDHGVEVFRPKFDPFINKKWQSLALKPTFSMSDRFFAYGELIFYLSKADDSEIPYFGYVRECLERMHADGKYVFINPLTLETTKMQDYENADWPGDEGFALDGPSFVPVENKILFNRKHCNTDRGIEWISKIIQKFYPDTIFVDVSQQLTNHLDGQVRIYNKNVASSNGSVGYIQKILDEVYPGIEVIDTSKYEVAKQEWKDKIFSGDEKATPEAEWLKSFIDFDDQNGNVDISNVSINSNTVVQNYNTFDLDKKLEAKGLKVENVKLRHSKFWGSGLPCETVVLEREQS